MNLHEMANYSANFRTNFFIFGIQVHNFVLKVQYKERGGNVEELLLAGLIQVKCQRHSDVVHLVVIRYLGAKKPQIHGKSTK